MHYILDQDNESLILEPEDYTKDEWATILKIFGMEKADRIKISNYTFEAYGIPRRAKEIVTYCKDCGYYDKFLHVCLGPPNIPMSPRNPDDFCSRAVKRKEK